MAQLKINEQTLRRILKRQCVDRWGIEYQASIFATPQEAPGISTGTILSPAKLGRREFHTLSLAETAAALLALYHPNVWEIHEQKMLSSLPRTHFLHGHARAVGLNLPPIAGTLDVAERLGVLSKHPRVLSKAANPDEWTAAPFPYMGDLLLYIDDGEGSYCLNWPVKDKYEDFRRKAHRHKPVPIGAGDDAGTVMRQTLEEVYHSDAGIRTCQIAGKSIDFVLVCNLRDIFLSHVYSVPLSPTQRSEAVEIIRSFVGEDRPANLIAFRIAKEMKITHHDATHLIKQAIWFREIRIDLFRTFLMDRPLRPELVDPIDRYAAWFARSVS